MMKEREREREKDRDESSSDLSPEPIRVLCPSSDGVRRCNLKCSSIGSESEYNEIKKY